MNAITSGRNTATDPGAICLELFLTLGKTYHAIRKNINATLETQSGHGLNLDDIAVLLFIADHDEEPATVNDVAQALYKDIAAISRQISNLQAEHWLVKSMDQYDRRKRNLHLTERAEGLIPELRDAVQKAFCLIFHPFGENETFELLAALQRVSLITDPENIQLELEHSNTQANSDFQP